MDRIGTAGIAGELANVVRYMTVAFGDSRDSYTVDSKGATSSPVACLSVNERDLNNQ